MKFTPLDIQQQQFKIRFRGFDIREVDAFLEQLADDFESVKSNNISLQDEISRLKLENQGYRQRVRRDIRPPIADTCACC